MVSTAPTEGSVTDLRPQSQFKEQDSLEEVSASSELSPERSHLEQKHSEAAEQGIQVIQYEPKPASFFQVPISAQ
jgi:hypothetical protein